MAEALSITCHELVNLDFRCGSKPVLRRHRQERLLLGVDRTKSARKRTWASECRLLGGKQTCPRHGWNFSY